MNRYHKHMEETTPDSTSIKRSSNDNASTVLREEVNLSEDDLTDAAKQKFPIHIEILRTYQLTARCIFANKRLSSIGRDLFYQTLVKDYTTYKNVLNYVAVHPNLERSTGSMPPPLIICSLPRTGTTFLHNLLACDPGCRALLTTDMVEPIPPLARSDVSGQMRRNQIVSAYDDLSSVQELADIEREKLASHPSFAHGEDWYILQQACISMFHCLLAPNKDSELVNWFINDANKDVAYDYHKTFLQMVNSVDAPRSHWLLKEPTHSLYLDTLIHHYPTASLIMTHRRLDEVLPSIARYVIAYTKTYFDSTKTEEIIDRDTVVQIILRIMDARIRALVKFRRSNCHTPVVDILYDDLVAQPVETVRRIYDYLKLTWSDEFELAMYAWLRDNPQGKQGRNTYTLEEFQLDHETIDKCYEEYNNMFLKPKINRTKMEL